MPGKGSSDVESSAIGDSAPSPRPGGVTRVHRYNTYYRNINWQVFRNASETIGECEWWVMSNTSFKICATHGDRTRLRGLLGQQNLVHELRGECHKAEDILKS